MQRLPSIEIDYTPGGESLQVTAEQVGVRGSARCLLVPAFRAASGPELKRVIDFSVLVNRTMTWFNSLNLTPGGLYDLYVS